MYCWKLFIGEPRCVYISPVYFTVFLNSYKYSVLTDSVFLIYQLLIFLFHKLTFTAQSRPWFSCYIIYPCVQVHILPFAFDLLLGLLNIPTERHYRSFWSIFYYSYYSSAPLLFHRHWFWGEISITEHAKSITELHST